MSHPIFIDEVRIVVESGIAAVIVRKILTDALGLTSECPFDFHLSYGRADTVSTARSALASDDRVALIVDAWGISAAAIEEQRKALETALGEDAWQKWLVIIVEPAIERLLFEDDALRAALLGSALTAEHAVIASYEPRKVLEQIAPELLQAHVLEQRLAPLDGARLASQPSVRALLDFIRWGAKERRMGAVHELLRALFAALEPEREHVVVLAFHFRGHLLGHKSIASGQEGHVFVGAQSVLRTAMLLGADELILAHSRPSGALEPSDRYRELTAELIAAGPRLGMGIIDHIIHGRGRHASLRAMSPELFKPRAEEGKA